MCELMCTYYICVYKYEYDSQCVTTLLLLLFVLSGHIMTLSSSDSSYTF